VVAGAFGPARLLRRDIDLQHHDSFIDGEHEYTMAELERPSSAPPLCLLGAMADQESDDEACPLQRTMESLSVHGGGGGAFRRSISAMSDEGGVPDRGSAKRVRLGSMRRSTWTQANYEAMCLAHTSTTQGF
jgi:hypothetical protein